MAKIFRLSDAKNIAGKELDKLNAKIEFVMASLAQNPTNNGNPLLFAISAGKPHKLCTDRECPTAATDSTSFYWGKKFLSKLNYAQTLTVLKHECYHILLMHVFKAKSKEFNYKLHNVAADFIVNSIIEREWRENISRISLSQKIDPMNHPLWKQPLGTPINFEELKQSYQDYALLLMGKLPRADQDVIPEPYSDLAEVNAQCTEEVTKFEIKPGKLVPLPLPPGFASCAEPMPECDDVGLDEGCVQPRILVDLSLLGRSTMDIYNELVKMWSDCGDQLLDFLNQFMMDEHIEGKAADSDTVKDILKALGIAKSLRGTIPSELEDVLAELYDPRLNLGSFLSQTTKKIMRDRGHKSDYTRFKRRFIGDKRYYHKYCESKPVGLVMLDTSGSMSDDDIARGVSELKQFNGTSDIYVVCVDACPHWDKITKITKEADFKKLKIIGRGGTVFEEFFRDYRVKTRGKVPHIDFIIAITDGDCDYIPPQYTPTCDVGWVLTRENKRFSQPFGKILTL